MFNLELSDYRIYFFSRGKAACPTLFVSKPLRASLFFFKRRSKHENLRSVLTVKTDTKNSFNPESPLISLHYLFSIFSYQNLS